MTAYKAQERTEIRNRILCPVETERLGKALPWVRSVVTKCFEEIEGLQAELREARGAVANVERACMREMDRAESAEAKNLELAAQVVALGDALENNQWIVGETGGEICPECGGMRRIGGHETYCSIHKALANLPAEAEKLVRLKAATEQLYADHHSGVFQDSECPCAVCKTIRDLRGEKP